MGDEETAERVDTSQLEETLRELTAVDKEGNQKSPVAWVIGLLVLLLVIAGVGIAMTVSRRKAVRAQYELDKLKEEQKRSEVSAQLEENVEQRADLEKESQRLTGLIHGKKKEMEEARSAYEKAAKDLASASSWDDIEVTRADP